MGTEKIVNKGHPGLNTKNISFKIWRLGSTHIAYARTSSDYCIGGKWGDYDLIKAKKYVFQKERSTLKCCWEINNDRDTARPSGEFWDRWLTRVEWGKN